MLPSIIRSQGRSKLAEQVDQKQFPRNLSVSVCTPSTFSRLDLKLLSNMVSGTSRKLGVVSLCLSTFTFTRSASAEQTLRTHRVHFPLPQTATIRRGRRRDVDYGLSDAPAATYAAPRYLPRTHVHYEVTLLCVILFSSCPCPSQEKH